MKNLCIFFALLLSIPGYNQNFTWVRGSSTSSIAGTYGTQNVYAPANDPGGRHGCAKWVDAAGNLWLFGGEGFSSTTTLCWMNDLWKYDVATNEWVWIRGSNGPNAPGVYGTVGVSAPTNEPGAREFAACWTDASGNLWMFGGDGMGTVTATLTARLGDLWKYNPAINEWTWVGGFNTTGQNGVYGTQGTPAPANVPGCRYAAGTWKDSNGDFWLFGGRGLPGGTAIQGYLNDLWKYNIASNQWTWVSGTNLAGQFGIYGPSGTPAPGARYFPACFTDASNNMYMFGGYGFATPSNVGFMNDFWKYDPIANTWAWINGSSNINIQGVYGTQNVSSASNVIGGRFAAASWKDGSGNFWIFGGTGLSSAITSGELNDLFKYDPSINQWTWMKGSTLADQNGTYGTLGIAAASNVPGARSYNNFWTGTNKLWLFGGEGYDAASTVVSHMNDLWTFALPCNPDSIIVAPGKIVCSGINTTLTAVNGGPSTVWYNSPVSTTSISGGSTLTVSSLTAANTQTVYSYYAEANSCTTSPRAAITITVNPLPTLNAVASQTKICEFHTATLTVSGASSYTWNTIPPTVSSSIIVTPQTIKVYTYTIVGEDLNKCLATTVVTLGVSECVGIEEITNTDFVYSVYPNPNNGEFIIKTETNFIKGDLTIFNALGQNIFEQPLYSDQSTIKTDLAKGIYYYRLELDNNKSVSRKLVIE